MVNRGPKRAFLAALSALAAVSWIAGGLPPAATATPAPTGDLAATALPLSERLEAEAPSSSLAQTDEDLVARTDAEPVGVLVKLDHDSAAAYDGGVGGLSATSPGVTGRQLTGRSPAELAYAAHQQQREDAVLAELLVKVPSARVGARLRTVYGGIAATIPASAVETVLAIDGVAAVQPDELRQPLTDSSPEFINAPPVYAQLGGAPDAGAGVIYGNLDSGVWPEHPSFADTGALSAPPPTPDGHARECDFGDNPLTREDDPFRCNNKLIGGAAFLDAYLSNPGRAEAEPFSSARDSVGHGTHTASTSAGIPVDEPTLLGTPLPPIHGIAPGAWVMAYKVCGTAGCLTSDVVAAVEQAVLDGVDVINYSISGGRSPFADPVELAFLDAYAAGILVAASAGNEGPGAGTANHLSPWVLSVAASTQRREFASTLRLTARGGATASFEGATITGGAEPAPVVLASAPPYGRAQCDAPAPPGAFEGRIVACRRGGNARVDKGFNVLAGGAEAMVLYNPTLADVETDTHWLPTIHLPDGAPLVDFLEANDDVTGSFPAGSAQEGTGDVMASFSSRGPAGRFLKPDVTAPGVQILAGDTPVQDSTASGPPGELYQAIAGTSMSAPHVSGAAVLLQALHPDWTPGQVKSALMTTAVTDVVKEDEATPADPFDMGAGRIDVGRAAAAPLTLDETKENFVAMGNDRMAAVDLNIPSINAPVMPGRLTTTRTVTNTSGGTEQFTASGRATTGSTISVEPATFSLADGESQELTITITSTAPVGEQQFGSVNLASEGSGDAHLPVAFVPRQGAVQLTQECAPTPLNGTATSTCSVHAVNASFTEQDVDITSTTDRYLRVVDSAGAPTSGQTVRLTTTLAAGRPGVPSVGPGELMGYVPLSALGVEPTPIGNEELLVSDVPAFVYNGRTYTSLAVSSNGYAVVGDATAADSECCDLPPGPAAARPNNIVAPFWTDLDGTDAAGISLALVDASDDDSWIVVQYDLEVAGTGDATTFQIWLGVGGEQDVTFAYDPADLPENHGNPFLVGAENELGAGDVEAVLPTGDLRVTSTDPEPGDVATYSYRVLGRMNGAGVAATELRAADVPGVTVVRDVIEVRAR